MLVFSFPSRLRSGPHAMRSSPLLFALACLGLMAAVVSATCADLQSAYGNPTDILSGVTFNSKAGVPTHTVNNLAVIFTQGTTYTAKRDQACAPSPVGNQPAWSISTAGTTFLGQASPGADINAGAAGESGFIFTCCTASLSKRDLVSSQPFTCTGCGAFSCFSPATVLVTVFPDLVSFCAAAILTIRAVVASCASRSRWLTVLAAAEIRYSLPK